MSVDFIRGMVYCRLIGRYNKFTYSVTSTNNSFDISIKVPINKKKNPLHIHIMKTLDKLESSQSILWAIDRILTQIDIEIDCL